MAFGLGRLMVLGDSEGKGPKGPETFSTPLTEEPWGVADDGSKRPSGGDEMLSPI